MLVNIVVALSIHVGLVYSIYCGSDGKFVQRGYLCCKPVFNCIPGYEVEACKTMYGRETCRRCQKGHAQPDYIGSYSESRSCFLQRDECSSRDLIPSSGRKDCYPKYCKCNTANCYIDDHCVCVRHPGCPINKTLDPTLKECVKCPMYTFKDHFGCGPCITDILLINSRYKTTDAENAIPETDLVTLNQKDTHHQNSGVKDNKTVRRKHRKRCKKCRKGKLLNGRNKNKDRKSDKRRYKKCKRKRRRCLRRNKIIRNNTERRT